MNRNVVLFSFIILPFCLFAQSEGQVQQPSIRLIDSANHTEVKDQSQSPTCWVFGTNSLFESDLLRKYNTNINLSEMFIARHAYIDKLNTYLATRGKTYYEGGGQFRDVLRVVEKYGMVPEQVYPGLVNGKSRHDHTKLDTAMRQIGRKLLKQGKMNLNEPDLRSVNDTLDKYLGKIPTAFWYDGKQYTPKTFATKYLHFENDYLDIMSFDNLPLYKKSLLNDKFNWSADSLFNVLLNDMETIIDSALANGWSVAWEGDVTEPGFQTFNGYAILFDTAHNYEQERLKDFKSEATARDHMLHIVGIGYDEWGKKWYYLKNSWGTWVNSFKGFLYMSEEYFKLKTVVIMVNKNALPNYLKEKLYLK